jgi:hypothetical protein
MLYLLTWKNYEFTKQKGIIRVHLQVINSYWCIFFAIHSSYSFLKTIISVSQLIGDLKVTNNSEFQDCLALLSTFSNNDQVFKVFFYLYLKN